VTTNPPTIGVIMGLVSQLEMVGVLAGSDPKDSHGPARKALHAEIERMIGSVAARHVAGSSVSTTRRFSIPTHLLDDAWLDAQMWGIVGEGEPTDRQRKNLRAFAHVVRARVLDGLIGCSKAAALSAAPAAPAKPEALKPATRLAAFGERIQALLRGHTSADVCTGAQRLASRLSSEVSVALISLGVLTYVVPRSELKSALLLLIDSDDPYNATYTITYKTMPRADYEALTALHDA
jgi:hypothetical protein